MLDDSVLKSNAVWADDVGIDDEVVFGVEIAGGHLLVPDHFGVGGFGLVHTGYDSSDN